MLLVQYKTQNTPFKFPFTTAHGLKTHQPALLLRIQSGPFSGMGEAPAIHYYPETVDSMIASLEKGMPILRRYAFTEPDRFWHFCHHLFPNETFLQCALDMAYWNMYAMAKRQSIRALWGLDENATGPMTDYTLGLDTPEKVIEKMKAMPWPIYKVKVASRSDMDILRLLRKETNAVIRIDANAAWSYDDAVALLPELEALQIELIEQPLAKDNWEGMKALKSISKIPLIADEACVQEHDVKRCAEGFHGINIKLTKCGGLTPARRMIEEARQLELHVMMGCMNETEIGSEAIAQFLPLLDYVDVDGPLLLDIPPLKTLHYDAGKVSLLKRP